MASGSFTTKMARHQKTWYGKWHVWMGIFAGSILVIVAITGSLLVFEQELDTLLNPELFEFEQGQDRLTYQQAIEAVSNAHPDWEIKSIFRMTDRNDAYQVIYSDDFRQAIVNPYTGEVTGTRIYAKTTMGVIRNLHRTLLIPTIGRYIVGFASIFMVILMITGLRLWIPKHWSRLKEKLTIKKGASFKRQNYDLHQSMGFYFSPFISLISLTGVAITFSPIVVLALFLVSFEPPKSIDEILGVPSTYQEGVNPISIDQAATLAMAEVPEGKVMGLTIPVDSVATYAVNLISPGKSQTGDFNIVNLDQYSGEVVLNLDDFPNIGKAYINWVTPIHYGTFGGLTTRIIALITTLMVPILFISGFIIWLERWKKRKKLADKPIKAMKGIKKPKTTSGQPEPTPEFVLEAKPVKS